MMSIYTWDHIMLKYRNLIIAGIVILFHQLTHTAVYDNRYYPPFPENPNVGLGRFSSFASDVFLATASRAFNDSDSTQDIGLSEIYGTYDQGQLARAMECVGQENLLLPEWRQYELRYHMRGKLQAQGYVIYGQKTINDYLFAGLNTLIMQTHGRTEFLFDNQSPNKVIGEGNNEELDQIRRNMNDLLGINAGAFRQIGFGDIDLYFGGYREWIIYISFVIFT